MHFIHHSHKGKGKARQGKRKKEKLAKVKGEMKKRRQPLLGSNSTMQPDRAHARTKRNEAIFRLDSPQPPTFFSTRLFAFLDL